MKGKGVKGTKRGNILRSLFADVQCGSVEINMTRRPAVVSVCALRDSLTKIVRERTDSEHLRA